MTEHDRYGTAYAERRDNDRPRDWDRSDESIFGFGRSREEWRRDYGSPRYIEQSQRGWDRPESASGGRREDWRGGSRFDRERDDDWGRGVTYYGSDDYHDRLPIDETSHLIASNKVEGTAVYGRDGDRLGTIYNFMVDKFTGQVEYAVMVYGGFIGLGERYFPLPWRALTYDRRRGGYHIEMAERDLRNAPSFDRDSEPHFNRDYGSRVHNYYGLRY